MLLNLLSNDALTTILDAAEWVPEPVFGWLGPLRVKVRTEIWHRDVETELTRRGYGRSPLAA